MKNYNINEYKVVGIVENPFYYSIDKEPSQVGSGKLSAIVYGFEEIFDLDVYTDFLITLDKGKEFDTFSSEYKDYVEELYFVSLINNDYGSDHYRASTIKNECVVVTKTLYRTKKLIK